MWLPMLGRGVSTVLVTGTSGHVGPQLATRLQRAGFGVRALVRTENQAAAVRSQGWTPVLGDLTDPGSLHAAIEGVDSVVHAAATGGPDLAKTQRVNVEGTRTLAQSALRAGVRRFVHISTISVHGDPLPSFVDEGTPLATRDPLPYCATKALAEVAVGEVRAQGLETVVLRPGMICHWVRSQWGNEMVERIRSRGWLEDLHPDDVMPWVHTENLAEMTWLALTHPGAANEVFLAVDRNVSMDEFYGPVARVVGQPEKVPDRPPHVTDCQVGKIATRLGYRPVHTFEETMEHLIALAQDSPSGP